MALARLAPAHPILVAADPPALLGLGEVAVGFVERHAALASELLEVVLAFVEALRLEDLHRAGAERLRFVGNHQAEVDADHAAEPAAGVAGADRRGKRKTRRRRVGAWDVAVRAVQVVREPPRQRLRLLVDYAYLAAVHSQRRLDRLDH